MPPRKKTPIELLAPPKPHYYGDGPREYGVEFLRSSDPDVWEMLRDDTSWTGWIWRWSEQQANDVARARTEETKRVHRALRIPGRAI